ncbi:MAG TPA: VOC family protein [Clostridia bacterium]|nr:VOC family protein [Clostridia bacterium]HPQ47266.1 VOC family protein [Clostridia bacterium]HRX43468.1 VOC family protein [Clostridia bacterium]
MKFRYVHNNINVLDLEKSISFYKENLGLEEKVRKVREAGRFTLVFMGDAVSGHQVELTWLWDRKEPYNLGDNEIHLAFRVDDFDKAYELHKKNGVICYENKDMGLYFIADPDGYWIEILPEK